MTLKNCASALVGLNRMASQCCRSNSHGGALKTARDAAAKRLELDPGVLCSRDRMEAVARRNPATVEELLEVSELRRWQAAELGEAFVAALAAHRGAAANGAPTPKRAPKAKRAEAEESPYKD